MPGAPILVVDDAPVNLKLMRLLLTHEGYDVRTAERAEDALEMLHDYRPELILADIRLPGMDGLEMTRHVKENPQTRPIRVVALTACAMKGDREKALSAGCEDYIAKPIATAALAAKVRELLTRPVNDCGRIGPEPASRPSPGTSGRPMENLRRSFLDEGFEQGRRLLDGLNSNFDRKHVTGLLHGWTGSAALLGYPEISSMARKAEDLLRAQSLNLFDLRNALTDLFLAFSELRTSPAAPPPDFVLEATSGKRVALIGFSAAFADGMCAVLERARVRPRLFEASEEPGSQAIGDCDLVIFHVRPETMGSAWLQTAPPSPAVKRLMYTGERDDLMALPAEVRSRALDFLSGPDEPQDVFMRLAFAFSRGATAVSTPQHLPAASAPVEELPARPRTAVSRPSILLADDDDIIRALVGATLQNYGMSCRTIDNGVAALKAIRSDAPHVALLDVNMPGMDGYEVLAAVRAEQIPTRVILLTSLQQEKDVVRAFNLGADDYVSKPFNPFELVARVRRLLQ